MEYAVTLDWPSQKSSMNSRAHWSGKAASQKAQRHASAMLCRHLPKCTHKGNIEVRVVFTPPDNRRRDADNLLSSIKLSLDAIAEQIGVDDSRFWPLVLDRDYASKIPKVLVILDY